MHPLPHGEHARSNKGVRTSRPGMTVRAGFINTSSRPSRTTRAEGYPSHASQHLQKARRRWWGTTTSMRVSSSAPKQNAYPSACAFSWSRPSAPLQDSCVRHRSQRNPLCRSMRSSETASGSSLPDLQSSKHHPTIQASPDYQRSSARNHSLTIKRHSSLWFKHAEFSAANQKNNADAPTTHLR